MNSAEWVLKAILNRYPASAREGLERYLPPSEKERLDAMPSAQVETDVEEPALLDRIHWSWILPELEPFSSREQKLLIASLPEHSRENLCRELKIKPAPNEEESRIALEFGAEVLIAALAGDPVKILPVYFLPPSPLSSLLRLDKQKLVELIDTLSLIDLAAELRQIVETKILKKIYSFISEEEKKALKKAAAMKQTAPAARLHLEKWDGTEKQLRLLLHKRGLARLGAALSGQHSDLVWYVCHQLDIGRGKALAKMTRSEPGSALDAIVSQIETVLKDFL